MGKIIVAGLGPGSQEDMTPAVLEAVRSADAIVGYKYYFQFVQPVMKAGCMCIDTGMKKERERHIIYQGVLSYIYYQLKY